MTPPPTYIVVRDGDRAPTGEWLLRHPCCQDLTRGTRVGLIVIGRHDPVDAIVVGRHNGQPTAAPAPAAAPVPATPHAAGVVAGTWVGIITAFVAVAGVAGLIWAITVELARRWP